MNILDNELVKKYFGDFGSHFIEDQYIIAYCVLRAMTEPIRRGEWYLAIENIEGIGVYERKMSAEVESIVPKFHPFYLRLPDKFQKKECQNAIECVNGGHLMKADRGCICGHFKPFQKRECECCDICKAWPHVGCLHCSCKDTAKVMGFNQPQRDEV